MVYDRILNLLRQRVRAQRYIMTLHAEEEMENDGLTLVDVEHIILTGHITERQKDKETGEWKYRVHGETITGGNGEVIVKLTPTYKLAVITVYSL